ncbi:ABC transporter ATP-binding protein [Micromonospora sp. R77]|uniref:ABC transporter ATP-binding protein n=1 Tax=Micromonospora sp. R77 TaxID=2925836 RepID=UPI001F612C58|nr:ABC transporter ATP-binding protein [Micromonospora sp. R77]MCI4061359.1 ABC transporter ATP-binding protein [Micromonospora sp. R77]
MSAPPAIELTGLAKRFGTVVAVDHLQLRVEPGEVVALLGPNGAGKTTTLDLLLGLARPDHGTVRLFGRTPADAVAAGDVAAVLQTGGLLKDLTVEETVRYVGSLYGQHSRAAIAEVMNRADLTGIARRRVGRCSGGQQQRLRFALAVLPEPRLLVLDEPTAGMDVSGRRDFWSAIRRDGAGGRTVLFSTHQLEEADTYADRVVLMRRGRVVADGEASEIRRLALGRLVRVTWPDADPGGLAELRRLPGVRSVEARGVTVWIRTEDSDAAARHLLHHTPARDLEVTSTSMEEAFLALTSDLDEQEATR